jgi:hypothetical protein
MASYNTEQLLSLNARQAEVFKRIKSGGLSIEAALAGTQGILDGLYPTQPVYQSPDWYDASPERQIEKASVFLDLYGGGQEGFLPSDIPAAPSFTSRTKTEVLLLTVMLPDKGRVKGLQRTFDAWWDFIVPPVGLTKWRWEELKSDSKHLRLASGIKYVPGIRWVAFDPNAYQGKSPKDALAQSVNDGTTLAHAEVLMAAAQFPGWVSSWNGGKSPYPNMSALQFYWDADWSSVVLYLYRLDGSRQLKLDASWADGAGSHWLSPVVREC